MAVGVFELEVTVFASARALSGVLSTHRSLPGAVTAIFRGPRYDLAAHFPTFTYERPCNRGGLHMKNATIKFLLPNAFPISKTGSYHEIGLWRSCAMWWAATARTSSPRQSRLGVPQQLETCWSVLGAGAAAVSWVPKPAHSDTERFSVCRLQNLHGFKCVSCAPDPCGVSKSILPP